jgi:hypothetical protein
VRAPPGAVEPVVHDRAWPVRRSRVVLCTVSAQGRSAAQHTAHGVDREAEVRLLPSRKPGQYQCPVESPAVAFLASGTDARLLIFQ